MNSKSSKALLAIVLSSVLFVFAGCWTEGNQPPPPPGGNEWKQLVDLSGEWKFSVGDNSEWASPVLNDENWETIHVPSSWENQGFHGYDGYAWYRNSFTLPEKYKNDVVYLFLGYVDDVDQVFINGKKVGYSGSFPPDYRSAYDVFRRYPVPMQLLNYNDKNTIAVRVYDDELEGGILRGDVGIYLPDYSLENGINLVGSWKFSTGDSLGWKDNNFDDSNWVNLIVPGYWENQGFPDYDGFAWYRRTVFVPQKFKDEKLVLLLGKIDDLDEVYINGRIAGSTGKMNDLRNLGDNYQKLRGYFLNKDAFKYGADNLIAVRVYDGFKDGGIYEGPVTIITQSEFTEYWNKIRKSPNFFEKIFN